VLAKTCQDVAQQGENKGRWKELTEQADSPDFSFFLNFFGNFDETKQGKAKVVKQSVVERR
jgi:hypothetical protein